jgi:hypothetical protein
MLQSSVAPDVARCSRTLQVIMRCRSASASAAARRSPCHVSWARWCRSAAHARIPIHMGTHTRAHAHMPTQSGRHALAHASEGTDERAENRQTNKQTHTHTAAETGNGPSCGVCAAGLRITLRCTADCCTAACCTAACCNYICAAGGGAAAGVALVRRVPLAGGCAHNPPHPPTRARAHAHSRIAATQATARARALLCLAEPIPIPSPPGTARAFGYHWHSSGPSGKSCLLQRRPPCCPSSARGGRCC